MRQCPLEERQMQECPKCPSNRIIKNGAAAGKPKKQCKQCGYQFTRCLVIDKRCQGS